MKPNPHFDAIAEGCGYAKEDITRTLGSLIGKVSAELKEVGATPEEILKRCEVYREKYQGFDLTPSALVKHWAGLKPKAESAWQIACRTAREKGMEPFKGRPYETPEQFIARVNQSNVVRMRNV